jgi:hypothetical protein
MECENKNIYNAPTIYKSYNSLLGDTRNILKKGVFFYDNGIQKLQVSQLILFWY